MIRYREMRPPAALASFVECFWTLEQDDGDSAPQRVVPDGHPELILNWGEPFEFLAGRTWHRQPRCFLAGQIDGPLLLRPRGRAKMLGVRFFPQGAAGVLGRPMHELAGRFTDAADFSARLARELDEALEAGDPMTGVEAALLRSAKAGVCDEVVGEAVRRIIGQRGSIDLGVLARELGMSVRQMERRFLSVVGLRPKVFCRMQRFMHVFGALDGGRKWADAAVECGYYDQSHLIRDFREFSGETPAALLGADADLARHFLQRFGVSHSSNTAGVVHASLGQETL